MIIPLILAGGSGTRLWPLSRKNYPKQLLELYNHLSLLQTTFNHIQYIQEAAEPIIICNEEHRFVIASQIEHINKKATILLENKSYNTAVAVASATLYAMSQFEDPLLLVLPSDLYISNPIELANILKSASDAARLGKLVTFGINPLSANKDYGYIKRGDKLSEQTGFIVDKFIEKPNMAAAEEFVNSGNYYWNSGIFLFQASVFVQELAQYAPRILALAENAVKQSERTRDFIYLNYESKLECPPMPVDKAIFEHTKRAVVFQFEGEWYDLGNWESLYQIGQKDQDFNVINGSVVSFDTKHSYLYSNEPLVVTVGISNCIVVATKDAILVANFDKKQDIKKVVECLISEKRIKQEETRS